MIKFAIAVVLSAATACIPVAVSAQDAAPTAPDGTPAFGIDPYFGVGGGYQDFDTGNKSGFQQGRSARAPSVDAFVGVDIPLGPFVVGVEGQASKGFQDIDFEYGATGRVGFRAGDSGLIYGRAGYRWIEGRRGFGNDRNEIYGVGVEVGPKDIGLGGLTGNAGVRLRLAADTYDLQSIRPSAAIVFHF